MKILLVEDDEGTAEILKTTLIEQHYLVDLAMDGQAGLEMAEAFIYDLILLDVMLPKLDGLDFCRQLRDRKDRTPVLLLTVLESNTSKIMGLEAGADDYVVKPFDLHELLARIRALLRRGSSALSSIIEAGKIALDSSSCRVTCDGQLLHLTAKEYALLELLLRNSHRIFSQQALLEHLWLFEEIPSENTLRTHIKTLRRKLRQAGADAIETVHGLGYRLKLGEDEVKNQAAVTAHSPSAAIATVTTVNQPKQQIAPARAAIWERYKHNYSDRIATLEQAIATLDRGELTPELGQQARAEAHLLIGALASFEFIEASQICRQIEQIFRAGVESSLEARLAQLVVTLRQELELPAATGELHERSLATVKQQPRLLIIDNDAQLGEQLISEATIWGIQAELVTDLTAARKAIAQNCPDVVLLDLCDNSAESGFNLLAELKTNNRHLPVLVLAAPDDFTNRIKVARLGGRVFLPKPAFPASVLTAINRVLSQSDTIAAKILVVDDDPQTLDILRTVLEPWGFKLALIDNPRHFWDKLEQYDPDLLILDVEMPELSGIDLCQVVRSDSHWCELPVLFLSVHTDTETINRVFTAGADDYVYKPIRSPELIARVLNRLERTQTLHKLADTDLLTGIANRRKSIQELNRLLRLAKRQSQPLCFVILDLDRFKLVNDRHGHAAGDRVLRRFGALLQQTFRSEDAIARWGGEEFVIGLYAATRQQAMARLTELLEIVQQQEFTGVSGEKFQVSFSGGIAQYPEDGTDLSALYRNADAALYVAKAGGRGQVSSWS
ncbi:response regulator [Chroococcidiopsis sp. FACHB-1243]|uniref:response regulator n=1 Tax=Chroococcidiopsis sp. [FACHB-1243] TaxID=2692781 RepID=UPI00178107A2|nr:response regulator [Chroococcidiopsis sp. [FACHB-1243]]MBD2309002.1 response regulator [Chroococcidiopsis sp. [FACHB-1243]]